MEEKHFLAFDCGATSCRAVLGRFADGGFSMEELYRFPNQILESEGRCYWDIGRIFAHSVGFLSQLGYVAAYAVSGTAADALGGIGDLGVGRGAALMIFIAGICLTTTASLILLPKSIRNLENK